MRTALRRHQREEEEESVFVSMTDMTVSFLFIIMILLAFFASQFNPEQSVPKPQYEQVLDDLKVAKADLQATLRDLAAATEKIDELNKRIAELEAKLTAKDPLETYLADTANERRRILEALRNQLKIDFPDLDVVLSEESDALRFQGDGLFQSSQSNLLPGPRKIVETIATRLEQILPCYTLGSRSKFSDGCNAGLAVIEAVQIEGHTDSSGDAISNLKLSTDRANATFVAMTEKVPPLTDFQNYRGQPVLSVAGYGEMRPIKPNDNGADMATNRRIDLRIIMYTPSKSEEIEKIRAALNAGIAGQTP